MKLLNLFIIIFFLYPFLVIAKLEQISKKDNIFYKNVFSKALYQESITGIRDNFTGNKVNNTYIKISDKNKKLLGYIREIATSTGCNSECKPLIFTLVISTKLKFLKVMNREPLTKYGHMKLTAEDYLKLGTLLSHPPASYKTINDTQEIIDAITMETKKEFKGDVVPLAALSTYRIYQYLIQTIKFIKN